MISIRCRAEQRPGRDHPLVGDLAHIDVATLRDAGLFGDDEYATAFFTVALNGGSRMCIERSLDDPQVIEVDVHISGVRRIPVAWTTTPCHFGGVRHWLICPSADCGRRTRELYFTPNPYALLCRICSGCTYPSQHESLEGRLLRRRARLLQDLKYQRPGAPGRRPPRPHHMHWSRYWPLSTKYLDNEVRLLDLWCPRAPREV